MSVKRIVLALGVAALLSWPAVEAQPQGKASDLEKEATQLLGRWIIVQSKEPGKPYTDGYKGRPFVREGPNSFILILEYRQDGTFRRISRVDGVDTIHEGTWKLSGHELTQKRKGQGADEVMYIRFDGPDAFTSIEVYEESNDPGLFAKFKRIQ